MSNTVVNAPIQNGDFLPDDRFGKVVPLYATDWLRTALTVTHPPIELWNNVTAAAQIGCTETDYVDTAQQRLAQKYGSLALRTIHQDSETIVLTDTEPVFLTWASQKTQELVEAGDLQVSTALVYACDGCDAALAMAEGPQPRQCVSCPEPSSIVTKIAKVLIGTLDAASREAVDRATSTVTSAQPTRTFIANKRRFAGISLAPLGFEQDVLDPRIGLGLLVAYSGILNESDEVTVVASRGTLRQNLQHYFAATQSIQSSLPDISMQGIAKAPANYLMHLRNEKIIVDTALMQLIRQRIVPKLFTMQRDMSPLMADQILFSKRSQ